MLGVATEAAPGRAVDGGAGGTGGAAVAPPPPQAASARGQARRQREAVATSPEADESAKSERTWSTEGEWSRSMLPRARAARVAE